MNFFEHIEFQDKAATPAQYTSATAAQTHKRVPLSNAQMDKVCSYLAAHLNGRMRVAGLAALIGMGRTSFFERFTMTASMTPNQYLQFLRIEKAKELMRNPRFTLLDIAFACGYSDQSHLTRFFKRSVGVSPGHYRREALAQRYPEQ
ncbi:helix-turn-helix domain-containing protein [Herminiimonas glaciei]|uniref:Helix-turn-helix domain-containing protein n=1 Tax=Herminiimonas glaciei TaxID=523788 RepID=A0ABW2I8Y2_9BURK